MSSRRPDRRGSAITTTVEKDRRLPPDAAGPRRIWRGLIGLLRRPLGFMRGEGHWRFGFVERRRAPPDALQAAEFRQELSTRMLAYPADDAAHMLRHLVQLHDELTRSGWAGVEQLPASVRSRALFQAQMLERDGHSPVLTRFIERLRSMQPAAEAPAVATAATASGGGKVQRRVRNFDDTASELEVSEGSHEDFEATSRSWFATLGPPEDPPEPGGAAEPPPVRPHNTP